MLKLAVAMILLATASACARQPAQANNHQPSEGSCMEFKWGGSTGIHWYSCCNNCVNGGPVDHCDKKTWQSASTKSYCGSCATNKGGGKLRGTEFKCGGCAGQEKIRRSCASFWTKIPGMCWAFSKCFHKKCQRTYAHRTGKRSVNTNETPETCYNGVCDAGETPDNCPMDCCYQKNPSCTWNGKCVPSCCGEIGCCDTSAGPINLAQTKTILMSIILTLSVCVQ